MTSKSMQGMVAHFPPIRRVVTISFQSQKMSVCEIKIEIQGNFTCPLFYSFLTPALLHCPKRGKSAMDHIDSVRTARHKVKLTFILCFGSDRNAFHLYMVISAACSSTLCYACAWLYKGWGYYADLSVPCNSIDFFSYIKHTILGCLPLNISLNWTVITYNANIGQQTNGYVFWLSWRLLGR